MTKPIIRIYTSIDEYVDREMTVDEFEQYKLDQAEANALNAEIEAKAKAKAAAQAKLAALGLTLEDLTALGL